MMQSQSLGAVRVKGRKSPVFPYVIDSSHFIRKSDIDGYLLQVFPEGETS